MKTVSRVIAMAILFGTCALTYAQGGPTGRWQAESTPRGTSWMAVLSANGPNVIGAVSSCASNQGREISDGTIDGDTITFKCSVGARRITFTGRMSGDEIASPSLGKCRFPKVIFLFRPPIEYLTPQHRDGLPPNAFLIPRTL